MKLLKSEFGALIVGWQQDAQTHRYLPPHPAHLHGFVYRCGPDEVKEFSKSLSFLSILVNAHVSIPVEELVAAALRQMAAVQDNQHAFLVAAGKELATLLCGPVPAIKNGAGEVTVMTGKYRRLGIVVTGSLNKGVEVRLDGESSIGDMRRRRYVTVEGKKRQFFAMITDVSLGVTDMQLTLTPPDIADPFIAEVLNGTSTYGTLHVLPMLTIAGGTESIIEGPAPVKTMPSHFSEVKPASQRDVELVFGKEDDKKFYIGTPLDMETKVSLNLEEMVKRSNGIFGKSGTGKTFLTRILLIGMLQKGTAVNLVFDMHSEYGWAGRSEKGVSVKGLKQLFPSKVAVFTLDEESSRRRKVSTDFAVRIGYDEMRTGRH